MNQYFYNPSPKVNNQGMVLALHIWCKFIMKCIVHFPILILHIAVQWTTVVLHLN